MDLPSQCISNFLFSSKNFSLNKTLLPSPEVTNETVLVGGGQGGVWKEEGESQWFGSNFSSWRNLLIMVRSQKRTHKVIPGDEKDTNLGKGRELRF